MSQIVKRKYTCSECAKTFKNAEDMHMHAEACLLDAFEMEAHALIMNQGYSTSHSGDNISKLASDYQLFFKPYDDAKSRKNKNSKKDDSGKPTDDGGDDELDGPPQLELAEPPQKKYKRIFPIGEDGKQIRPKMECPTCGLVLYRHNFSTHYRIHTGELPFTCSFCDKRFRTSSALTVHTRCHTGDRPYSCPHCDYSCITKRNLDRHIINNHIKRRRVYVDRNGSEMSLRRRGRPGAFCYMTDTGDYAAVDDTDLENDDTLQEEEEEDNDSLTLQAESAE